MLGCELQVSTSMLTLADCHTVYPFLCAKRIGYYLWLCFFQSGFRPCCSAADHEEGDGSSR